MATANRVISIIGLLSFGGLLLLATLAPAHFEQAARSFVTAEVRAQLGPVLDSKAGQKLKAAYGAWKARGNADPAGSEVDPVPEVAKQLAAIIDGLCHFSCAEKQKLETTIETGLRGTLSRLVAERDKFVTLAKNKYKEIVTKLRRDFIIFAASNVGIFAVLLAATFIGPRAYRALMLPAVLLTISTLISASIYIFGQNWFFTILYDDYVGYGYLAYVMFIFAFFLCVVYVRAGGIVPGPIETGAEVIEACATGPVEATAEAVVSGAESIVELFVDILAGLIPG
jgi:hypothetical protein